MSNQEKSTTDTVLDTVQGALDLIGLIPVIGDACDLINAGISLARGDFTGAAISLVAMIPGLGAAGPLLKALNKLPPGVLKAITDILAKLGDLFSKVPFWKIVDGAKGILDELLTLIEKHLPELGKMLREFCCDKLGMACFIAGTLIHTPGGSVPIEDIRPGDLVFAQNPDTGELGVKRVENTFVREVYVTYDLHFESESLTTTAEHPFWVYGKGFKTADELMAGDEILCDISGDEEFRVAEVLEITKSLHEEYVTVYNFSVEEWHTYFVGQTGLLAHNAKYGVDEVLEEGAEEAAERTAREAAEKQAKEAVADGPTEPYDRKKHYGNTPTAKDREVIGGSPDHDPPLVQRYYDGDPKIGEKPGYQMTPEERRASAQDRSRMKPSTIEEQKRQGAEMSRYSRRKKKEHGL